MMFPCAVHNALASFPGLPGFCSLVSDTQKQKDGILVIKHKLMWPELASLHCW